MWIFVVVAVIALIAGFGRSAFKNAQYKRNLYNTEAFRQDCQKPYMSSQQLNANIRSGKYRKPNKTRSTQKAKAARVGQNPAAGRENSTGNAQTSQSAGSGQGMTTAASKPSYSKIEQDAIDVLKHASTDIPVELETLTQEQHTETSHISDSQKRLNAGAVANAKSDFSEIEKRFEEGQGVFPRTIGDYVFSSFDYKSYTAGKCFSSIQNTDFNSRYDRYGVSVFSVNNEHNALYLETIKALGRNAGISIVPVARDMDNKIDIMDIPSTASGLALPPQIVFCLRCTAAHMK